MSKDKQNSGMEDVPSIYSRPLVKDRFFWITVGMFIFWAAVIWYLFFT